MSNTPRTDKEQFFPHDSKYKVCDADFCRQLERELNRMADRINRLEEAGDALLELCEADESKFHLADHIDARCDAWRKAKEANP